WLSSASWLSIHPFEWDTLTRQLACPPKLQGYRMSSAPSNIVLRTSCAGSRVSFRSRKSARCTRPGTACPGRATPDLIRGSEDPGPRGHQMTTEVGEPLTIAICNRPASDWNAADWRDF